MVESERSAKERGVNPVSVIMAYITGAHEDSIARDIHAITDVCGGSHLAECDGAVGGSIQTTFSLAVVESAGTDCDRTRGASEVVIKFSAIAIIDIRRHLVEHDGAFGADFQTIVIRSSGGAIEGAGTDAHRTVATSNISALGMIEIGGHLAERDASADIGIEALAPIKFV